MKMKNEINMIAVHTFYQSKYEVSKVLTFYVLVLGRENETLCDDAAVIVWSSRWTDVVVLLSVTQRRTDIIRQTTVWFVGSQRCCCELPL